MNYALLHRFRTYALINEFFYFLLGVQSFSFGPEVSEAKAKALATLTSFGLQVSYNF